MAASQLKEQRAAVCVADAPVSHTGTLSFHEKPKVIRRSGLETFTFSAPPPERSEHDHRHRDTRRKPHSCALTQTRPAPALMPSQQLPDRVDATLAVFNPNVIGPATGAS